MPNNGGPLQEDMSTTDAKTIRIPIYTPAAIMYHKMSCRLWPNVPGNAQVVAPDAPFSTSMGAPIGDNYLERENRIASGRVWTIDYYD